MDDRAEAGVRDLAILIEAESGSAGGRGADAPHVLGAVPMGRSGAVPALVDLVQASAARHVFWGYGGDAERLRGTWPALAGRVLPAAAVEAPALVAHVPELVGFEGDLLVVPAARAGTAPAALAVLRELHAGEGNAATILEDDAPSAAGSATVTRDELGRVTGLVAPHDPARAGGRRPLDLVVVFHVPSLLAVLRGRVGEARPDAMWLTQAVGWLQAAGRSVGAVRAPAVGTCCPRCHGDVAASAANGLLLASRSACLAVERPGFNSGQLVCYPRRHVTCALSLAPAEWDDLAALLREGARLARRVYDFDALNVGLSSGAGAHVAIALIPRWIGDLNFLPLVSGFKAVPEKPEEAWRRYREVLV